MMSTVSAEDTRNSFIDGIFAHTFATLTGGAFLTGFALYLGMNEFLIGLMGAMPYLALSCVIGVATGLVCHRLRGFPVSDLGNGFFVCRGIALRR